MTHNTNKGRKLGPSNRAVWPTGWKKKGPTKERLHAAAPDLLAALKEIAAIRYDPTDRVSAIARAAIAKAEVQS